MGKSWSAQRGNEGRRGAGVPSGRQAQAGRVSARGHCTLGGRAKSTGSRASGTSSSTSRRRALHTFLASAASAAIRAIAETRPDYPSAAGRDLKPRGAGRSHAEPPRPRLLGDRESGGQGTGKGPQSPHPADLYHARHSGLRWEIGRKPDGAEGLSTVTPVQTLRDRPCYCDPQMASNDRACSLF